MQRRQNPHLKPYLVSYEIKFQHSQPGFGQSCPNVWTVQIQWSLDGNNRVRSWQVIYAK